MKASPSLLSSLLMLAAVGLPAQPAATDAFAQCRQLGRGVNILGYDPIWRSRQAGRFEAKHFRLLKEAGFNSVRINLMPFRAMNPTNGWQVRASWFETMDWAVAQAQEQGLSAILDLHEFTAMGKDPEGNKTRFLAFWIQMSAHCRQLPDSVLFEILNEPSDKLTPALWNDYLREALAVIREQNPRRGVIVGPAFWNSLAHLEELNLPANDTNLIVTIHYYEPFAFTHQGAAWAHREDKLGVAWEGTPQETAAIAKDFDQVAAWAKARQRPIFLGEFGAYDKAPMDARCRWTACVARAAEQRGWNWAYWQFDSDFILYDMRAQAWVEPIYKALLPAPAR